MKCAYHPDTEALDICPLCRRPVCERCTVSLAGKNYCRVCLEKRVVGYPGRSGAKNSFLAFLCSLIPGAGYLYLNLMRRGLQALMIFFGAVCLAAAAHLGILRAFVVPVMIFYSVFDTQHLLGRINAGQYVEDGDLFDWGNVKKQNLFSAGLIIIGLFALLDNMIPYFFPYDILSKVVPPLAILGAGIYILYRNVVGRGGN